MTAFLIIVAIVGWIAAVVLGLCFWNTKTSLTEFEESYGSDTRNKGRELTKRENQRQNLLRLLHRIHVERRPKGGQKLRLEQWQWAADMAADVLPHGEVSILDFIDAAFPGVSKEPDDDEEPDGIYKRAVCEDHSRELPRELKLKRELNHRELVVLRAAVSFLAANVDDANEALKWADDGDEEHVNCTDIRLPDDTVQGALQGIEINEVLGMLVKASNVNAAVISPKNHLTYSEEV